MIYLLNIIIMGFIAVSIAGIAAIKTMCGVAVGLSVANLGLTSYFHWQEPIDNFFNGPVKDFFTGKYFRRGGEANNEVNENTPLMEGTDENTNGNAAEEH